MKIRLFCFFVIIALFSDCISAQEHIQVKAETAMKDWGKAIVITITNTSDNDIRIVYFPSLSNNVKSYFTVRFLDGNGQIAVQNYRELPLWRDFEKEIKKMIILKPHTSEKLDYSVDDILVDLRKHDRAKYDSIKKFTVTYYILYQLVDKDSSVLSRHRYEKTSDPIAF